VKENRTIHLQIKQAKLLPMGLIDNTSMSWVDLPRISLNDWLDRAKYHKLSYESRSFDLDDLVSTNGYIITGKCDYLTCSPLICNIMRLTCVVVFRSTNAYYRIALKC